MAVTLEIEDGDPWYLSPNVWVVPGDNPEGSPGIPIAGKTSYLWARVRNSGQDRVSNATVRFYWANPAVGFDRTTATLVGTAFVTLDGGQTADVLCLTPWVPVYVNQGHECILAEAFHPSLDPLPGTLAFDVPTDRHVAQRNLSVLKLSERSFSFAFEIHNPARQARTFTLNATEADPGQLERLVPLLGRDFKLPGKRGRLQRLGFVQELCPDARAIEGATPRVEKLQLASGERTGYSLVGVLEGGSALVHVIQEVDGNVVGGLSVLALAAQEE
jgi:hypothetical protein